MQKPSEAAARRANCAAEEAARQWLSAASKGMAMSAAAATLDLPDKNHHLVVEGHGRDRKCAHHAREARLEASRPAANELAEMAEAERCMSTS